MDIKSFDYSSISNTYYFREEYNGNSPAIELEPQRTNTITLSSVSGGGSVSLEITSSLSSNVKDNTAIWLETTLDNITSQGAIDIYGGYSFVRVIAADSTNYTIQLRTN